MKQILFGIFFLLFTFIAFSQQEASPVYFKAEDAFRAGDFSSAIALAGTIAQTDPYFENALILTGHAYLRQDSLEQAETAFFKAIQHNPHSALAYNGMGLVYYNRISDAKKIVKLLKSIFSESAESKAEKMFYRALDNDPDYFDARFNLARMFVEFGNDEDMATAENVLNHLIAEFPDNTAILVWRGRLWLNRGNIAAAEKDLSKAVNLDPLNDTANFFLAMVMFELNRPQDMTRYYYTALENLQDEKVGLKILRDCYDILGDSRADIDGRELVNGEDLLQFWRRRDPNPVTVENERLVIHYQRLRFARSMYKADNFTGYDDRGTIYVRFGKPDERYTDAGATMEVRDNESWVYHIEGKTVAYDFVELGAYFRLVNDLSEALQSGAIQDPLKTLTRVYEKRSHLDGPYLRIANNLSQTVVGTPSDTKLGNISPAFTRENVKKINVYKSLPRSTFSYKLEGDDLPFNYNYAWFYDQGRVRLEMYLGVPKKEIFNKLDSASILPVLKQDVVIQDENYNTLVSGGVENKLTGLEQGDMFITQNNVHISEPAVNLSLQLSCAQSGQIRFIQMPVSFPQWEPDRFTVSGIQLSADIHPAKKNDSKRFIKHNLYINPYPYDVVDRNSPLFLYFELYNLSLLNKQGHFKVEIKIVQEADESDFTALIRRINPFSSDQPQSVSTTYEGKSTESMAPEYIGLDLSALNSGNYRLTVMVLDLNSDQRGSRRVRFKVN